MRESTKLFLAGVAIVALCTLCLILGGEIGKQAERQRWGAMDAESIAEIRAERDAEIAECSLSDARADRCYIPCATDADCIEKNGMSDH